MYASRAYRMIGGSACLALALGAVAPSLANAAQLQKKRAAFDLSGDTDSIGSFTPAAADPRAAASFARARLGQSGFRFTPSVSLGARRAVTVAVRARSSAHGGTERLAVAANTGFTPSAYNLGVAVGWKHFALSGDVARVDTGVMPGGRESADVAVSYAGRRWSTRLQFGADRSIGEALRLVGTDRSYSLDFGGSYSLTRNLDVTGGLRYRMQHDRLERLADERRDSQAVYIGTAFKF